MHHMSVQELEESPVPSYTKSKGPVVLLQALLDARDGSGF